MECRVLCLQNPLVWDRFVSPFAFCSPGAVRSFRRPSTTTLCCPPILVTRPTPATRISSCSFFRLTICCPLLVPTASPPTFELPLVPPSVPCYDGMATGNFGSCVNSFFAFFHKGFARSVVGKIVDHSRDNLPFFLFNLKLCVPQSLRLYFNFILKFPLLTSLLHFRYFLYFLPIFSCEGLVFLQKGGFVYNRALHFLFFYIGFHFFPLFYLGSTMHPFTMIV